MNIGGVEVKKGNVVRVYGLDGGPIDITVGGVEEGGDRVWLIPNSGPMHLPGGTVPPGGLWHQHATED